MAKPTIPQLTYWLAHTMDPQLAQAFKNGGYISQTDAAMVELTVQTPVMSPLLAAVRAASKPGTSNPWDPVCSLQTLVAMSQAAAPAGNNGP